MKILRKITDSKSLKTFQKKFYDGVFTAHRLQPCYKENSPQIVYGKCTEN